MIQNKVFPAVAYNPGDNKPVDTEELIDDLKLHVYKFNNRPRPENKDRVVIFSAFSEFGCESLLPLYCIPKLLKEKYRGYYSIVMGWYGRDYLYRHLVDEYWEVDHSYQHLRNYCRAFHHTSRNLLRAEKQAAKIGKVANAKEITKVALHPRTLKCVAKGCDGRVSQFRDFQQCQKCGTTYPSVGFFDDCSKAKKSAKWVPLPCEEKMEKARRNLPPNAVGLTARGRKTYGRNLNPEFYEQLIWLLEDMGYNPVWLGEEITTLPCPCPRLFNLRGHPDARDLEQTLAYVANMKFTIQFWTASTRLSGMVGTPFILFESPDQIWGGGQEGMRLHLTSRGPKKLVVAHFKSVMEDNTKALKVAENAIRDVEQKDFSTTMGLVENEVTVRALIRDNKHRISWF